MPCSDAQVANRHVRVRVWARRDRKWSLNDGQIPNSRGVRVNVHYGLQSCGGKSAGVAKRRRERAPTRNPYRYDSQLLHRCMSKAWQMGSIGGGREVARKPCRDDCAGGWTRRWGGRRRRWCSWRFRAGSASPHRPPVVPPLSSLLIREESEWKEEKDESGGRASEFEPRWGGCHTRKVTGCEKDDDADAVRPDSRSRRSAHTPPWRCRQ
jgi:hypothetical protein